MFYDKADGAVRLTLRRLRECNEVYGDASNRGIYRGVRCVWEEVGEGSHFLATPDHLDDLCAVFTQQEVDEGLHLQNQLEERACTLMGAGYFERRKRRRGQHERGPAYCPKRQTEWSREGGPGEHFLDMRNPQMNLNVDNLPYASMPLVWYFDKYNAMGMNNQVKTTPHV